MSEYENISKVRTIDQVAVELIDKLERERDDALERVKQVEFSDRVIKRHTDRKNVEIRRLRKIITDADHSMDCESRKYYMAIVDEDCDCWKSEALKDD